ncbi:MAG: 1-acyl-sn-glycerol-3-phosphate acyltransferase [Kiritimatiellae bacterium]|nr:1-acyl-sn-glycerol-3-phosphate acyltransferase [Kiritimatiellia bacterium]
MRKITDFLETFRETGSYRTPVERLGKQRKNGFWTSLVYNIRGLGGSMARATWLSHRGLFTDERWQECGLHLLWETERMGTEVIIEGFEKLKDVGPVVVVSNHMSLYETFACPPLVGAFGEVAIVLKESLMKVPLLGQTFSTRKMIPVGRKDPKADLKSVLEKGEWFLREDKTSVLLYPQGTRQPYFDCRKFNTLGVKLAQNAGVPIVPVVGQTAFLGVGRYTKDFGPVDTTIPVRFACGPVIPVTRANAKAAQAQCVDFIASKLEEWGKIEVRR